MRRMIKPQPIDTLTLKKSFATITAECQHFNETELEQINTYVNRFAARQAESLRKDIAYAELLRKRILADYAERRAAAVITA